MFFTTDLPVKCSSYFLSGKKEKEALFQENNLYLVEGTSYHNEALFSCLLFSVTTRLHADGQKSRDQRSTYDMKSTSTRDQKMRTHLFSPRPSFNLVLSVWRVWPYSLHCPEEAPCSIVPLTTAQPTPLWGEPVHSGSSCTFEGKRSTCLVITIMNTLSQGLTFLLNQAK